MLTYYIKPKQKKIKSSIFKIKSKKYTFLKNNNFKKKVLVQQNFESKDNLKKKNSSLKVNSNYITRIYQIKKQIWERKIKKLKEIKEKIKNKTFQETNENKKIVSKLKKINLDTLTFKKKWKKVLPLCISIKVVAHNVFCTFWSLKGRSRTYGTYSAGMHKIKIVTRNIYFGAYFAIISFFKKFSAWYKKYCNIAYSKIYFNLRAPFKIRKNLIALISPKVAVTNLEYAKPFNGCTAKKARRKKRIALKHIKLKLN